MSLNPLTSIYLPDFTELSNDQIKEVRRRFVTYMQSALPTVDTAPNTVAGDLLISPLSLITTATEVGLERFMSDLDLENVANGIIYNCDFVSKYLNNFAVNPALNMRSSGVIRLAFSEYKKITLDRNAQFSYSNLIFSIYMPLSGAVQITPFSQIDSAVDPSLNIIPLKVGGNNVYFCDIPVVGHASGSVPIGSSFSVNFKEPTLSSAIALFDFDSGIYTDTLPDLAKKTRETIYAASLNTRNGAIRYTKQIAPFVEGVSPVVASDYECYEPLSGNVLDIYVRSNGYAFQDTQLIRTRNILGDLWECDWQYSGLPIFIQKITQPGINIASIPYDLKRNKDSIYPYQISQYPDQYLFQIPDIKDKNNETIFTYQIDAATGDKVAWFVVSYVQDPMFIALKEALNNPDNAPINVVLNVCGFIPIIINSFKINYVKKAGTVPLLEEAKQKILSYFSNLGYPDKYSDGIIANIMQEAGVSYIRDININAYLQTDIATLNSNAESTNQKIPINSTSDLRNNFTWNYLYNNTVKIAKAGPRNIRFYVLDTAIELHEVKEF